MGDGWQGGPRPDLEKGCRRRRIFPIPLSEAQLSFPLAGFDLVTSSRLFHPCVLLSLFLGICVVCYFLPPQLEMMSKSHRTCTAPPTHRMMVHSFIGSQKFTVQQTLERKFSRYLTLPQDYHSLLMSLLRQSLKAAQREQALAGEWQGSQVKILGRWGEV